MKIMIAIDPGKNGAIAVRRGDKTVCVWKMPCTPEKIHLTLCSVGRGLSWEGIEAILEKVHSFPTDGKVSVATFMRHCGHLDMALISLGIPYDEVAPKAWQKALGVELPKDKPERKREIKALMQRRYPKIKVTLYNADALAMLTVWMDGKI